MFPGSFLFSGFEIGEKGRAFPFPPRILIPFHCEQKSHQNTSQSHHPTTFISVQSCVFPFLTYFSLMRKIGKKIGREEVLRWETEKTVSEERCGKARVGCMSSTLCPTQPLTPHHRSYHIWFTYPYSL